MIRDYAQELFDIVALLAIGATLGYDRGESHGFDRGYDWAIEMAVQKGVAERCGPCLVWRECNEKK